MAVELSAHDSIAEIDPERWDALAAGSPMLRHGYLAATEHAAVAGARRRYLVWRSSDGELVAHSWCFSMTASPEGMLPEDHWAARLSRRLPAWARARLGLRVVVCGSATTVGHTLCFSPTLDAGARDRCLRELTDALRAFAVEQRCRIILLRDFRPQDAHLTEGFPALRFSHVANLDDTVILIRWRSFDDYLAALKSHYRKQILRQDAALTAADICRVRTADWAAHAPRMAELYANIARRYAGGSLIGVDFFVASSGCPGLETTLFFQDDRLVAFIMYYVGETALFSSYVGVETALNGEAALTFNAYNEVVRVAIERGVQHLWFGRTAYDAKLRMGAERRALSTYVQTRPAFIGRRIARWIRARAAPPADLDRWDVFRQAAEPATA